MILLVDPNNESLLEVVENSSGVRPITGHSRRGEERRDWLVEEVVFVDELLLKLFRHFWQFEVSSSELTVELAVMESAGEDFLYLSSFSSGAHRWE